MPEEVSLHRTLSRHRMHLTAAHVTIPCGTHHVFVRHRSVRCRSLSVVVLRAQERQSRPSGMMGECDSLGSPWLRPSEGPASRGDVITGEIVWRLPMASMAVSSTSPPALLWQEMGLRDPGKGRGRSWHVQGDMGAPRSFWIESHETADSMGVALGF